MASEKTEVPSRRATGILFACVMGVCGLVLVGIGDTLSEIADNVRVSDEYLGQVFLTRGLGQLIASPLASRLFLKYEGHTILATGCLLMSLLWLMTSSMVAVWQVHFWFFTSGVVTATLDTGVQILTRRVWGVSAGTWLQTNTLFFGCSGSLAPLVYYLVNIPGTEVPGTTSILRETSVYALGCAGVAVAIMYLFNDYSLLPKIRESPEEVAESEKLPLVEMLRESAVGAELTRERWIGGVIFLAIGGQSAFTAYLQTFIDDSNVISSGAASGALTVLWSTQTLSRLGAVYYQAGMTPGRLLGVTGTFVLGSSLGVMFLWAASVDEGNVAPAALFISVCLYGIFIGPILGFCYDLQNQLRDQKGATNASWIPIWFLNLGTTCVPFITSLVWYIDKLEYKALPLVLTVCGVGMTLMLYSFVACAMRVVPGKLPYWDLTFGYKQGSWPGLVTVLYLIIVTIFFFISSSFPAMYYSQFDGTSGHACTASWEFCTDKDEELPTVIWFMFLWGLGFWALARHLSSSFRRAVSQMIVHKDFPGLWTNASEIALVTSFVLITLLWWAVWWNQIDDDLFAKTLGHYQDLLLSMLVLLSCKVSFWDHMFGISQDRSVIYHKALGTLFFVSVILHFVLWQLKWLRDGEWVDGITQQTETNENLVTGESCDFSENMQASCGNGHFLWIPAMEIWLLLLGLPALALTHPGVRSRAYELFYYAHFQFVILFPISFYHSWHLWKYATVSLALYLVSWIIQRYRRLAAPVNVVKLEAAARGVTLLKLKPQENQGPHMKHIAGQYCMLNIPEIDPLQWHPFTISSGPSVEHDEWTHHIKALGVSRHEAEDSLGRTLSWTQRLHNLALDNEKNISIYVDGPYGMPPFRWSDTGGHVILVAGGIGITPFLALLEDLFARVTVRQDSSGGEFSPPAVHLVWVVPSKAMLALLSREILEKLEHLALLEDCIPCKFDVYVTGSVATDEKSSLTLTDFPSSYPGKDLSSFPNWLRLHEGRPDFQLVLAETPVQKLNSAPSKDIASSNSVLSSKPETKELLKVPLDVCVSGPEGISAAVETACMQRALKSKYSTCFWQLHFAL